jgi:hypothetical protein
MKYLLTIWEDDAVYADGTGAAMGAIIARHMAFGQEVGAAMLHGGGLERAETATTVRTDDGVQTLHDGPFAETKEQLGGFYVIEAADLDGALAIARKVPLAKNGAIEVRPFMMPPGM